MNGTVFSELELGLLQYRILLSAEILLSAMLSSGVGLLDRGLSVVIVCPCHGLDKQDVQRTLLAGPTEERDTVTN